MMKSVVVWSVREDDGGETLEPRGRCGDRGVVAVFRPLLLGGEDWGRLSSLFCPIFTLTYAMFYAPCYWPGFAING